MRDAWIILLFIGGIVIGGAAGAVYHQFAASSLAQTITLRDDEIDQLKEKATRERKIAVASQNKSAAQLDQLQREFDALQVELAEQKRVADLQRGQIAKFLNPAVAAEAVKPADEEPDLSEPVPFENEDGRVRGGKIAYHKLKMEPVEGELQITGEIENLSEKRFRSLILHVELFGAGRRRIEVIPISIDGLEPGATRAFTVAGLTNRPDLYDAVKRFKITTALLSEDRSNPTEKSVTKPPAARRGP